MRSMEYDYLKEVLFFYNIKEANVALLRHNENLTFRLGTDYLVQIHAHADGFYTDYLYEDIDRIVVYEAEIQFLQYLKEQGLTVREPIQNRYGEWRTRLKDGTLVTVSKWIEGEALSSVKISDELCYQIGELLASLHKCAKGFQAQSVVSYDEQHCRRIKERLQVLEGMGLDAVHSEIMQKACDVVEKSLRKRKADFLMLHADLSLSNILLTENGLVAIDFSLFGMGHPMLDLAILFGNIGGLACRQKIAEGYKAAGGIINYEVLESCYVLTILDCIVIHFEQWSKQEWFEERMARWRKENFEPFERGERLFTDDFYLIHVKG